MNLPVSLKLHNKTQVILDINKGLKASWQKENGILIFDLYAAFVAPGKSSFDKKYSNMMAFHPFRTAG